MNQILAKIPVPILVVGTLVIALIAIVIYRPLEDECAVQGKVFDRNTKGLLFPFKTASKKIQFAKIPQLRDVCREGNSIGACAQYLESWYKVSNELRLMNDHCKVKYSEENEGFLGQVSSALQVISLAAWGEKPPAGPAERAGWLTETDIKTFCQIKNLYSLLAGEEGLVAIRNAVYSQYPDEWPEKLRPQEGAEADLRKPEDRPRAMKSAANPNGQFDSRQIFERSLFSMRCNLYL